MQKLNEVKKAIIEDKKLADESLKDMPELKRLSAYFELKNAIDEHGFSYAQYGLTEERAMVLASLNTEMVSKLRHTAEPLRLMDALAPITGYSTVL